MLSFVAECTFCDDKKMILFMLFEVTTYINYAIEMQKIDAHDMTRLMKDFIEMCFYISMKIRLIKDFIEMCLYIRMKIYTSVT